MRQNKLFICLVLAAAACTAAAQGSGEVAYAGPPAAEVAAALASDNPLTCEKPCYTVSSRHPFKQCTLTCDAELCNRGFGAFQSEAVCCEVSFPDSGCTSRPDQCWVVESYQLRTCVRDDRKCLQGFGVFATEEACCAPQGPAGEPLATIPGAFPDGCGNVTKAAEPCWVVDTYWPSRQCRQSRTLCGADSGMRAFANRSACCAPQTGAFGEGCSNRTIPVPCFVVDSYYPNRSCRRSSDVAVCNRGWGVFASEDICCAPGASFAEGCTVRSNLTATTPAATGPGAKPATPGAKPATPGAMTTEAGPAATVLPTAQPQTVPVVPAVVAPNTTQTVPVVPAVVAPNTTQPGALPAVLPVVPVATAPLPSAVPAGRK